MRRERCGFVLAVGLRLITSAASGQHEKDRKIDLPKVPAAVKKAADTAAPGVTWHHASKETEEGKTIYEPTGKDAKGRKVEVGHPRGRGHGGRDRDSAQRGPQGRA